LGSLKPLMGETRRGPAGRGGRGLARANSKVIGGGDGPGLWEEVSSKGGGFNEKKGRSKIHSSGGAHKS